MFFAGGFHCTCPESRKPLKLRAWVVISRAPEHRGLANYWSKKYSVVHCRTCWATGKSSAKLVAKLPDGYFSDDPQHPKNRNKTQ